jgi:hypothetical protein
MLVALIVSLMILLFPKNMIQNAIEEEKSNYDLTLIYLKSIAEAYPDDPRNWKRLLDAQLKMADTTDAEKVFQMLDHKMQMSKEEKALWNYRLLKDRYKKSEGAQKEHIRKILVKRLASFLKSTYPSQWYLVMEETRALNLPLLRFEALKKYLTNTTLIDDKKLYEALTLATELKKEHDLQTILNHIATVDPDKKMLKMVENHYLANRNYAAVAHFFETYFLHSGKMEALLKSIRYYFWANAPQQARKLLDKHQRILMQKPKIAEATIKLILENNQLKAAKSFTLKTLEKERLLP